MSSFHADLIAAIRRSSADVVWLLKLDITTPSALTLRFGTVDYITPDGATWESGFNGEPIRDAVDFMGPGPNLVPWQFTLANRTLSHPTSTRLDALFSQYRFKGAAVSLYLWERSLDDFSKAGLVYGGHITDYKPTATHVEFVCSQPIAWNVVVPNKVVDTTNAPNATEATLGLPFPIIVGDWKKPTMPSPFANSSTEIIASDESGGGRLAVPFLLTDPGTGAADVKVVAACHELSKLFDQNNGYGVFTPGLNDQLAYFGTGGTVVHTGSSESYIDIDDGASECVVGISPCAVNTSGAAFVNSAGNPRAAMNPLDQTQYATIDQNTAANQLSLLWPDTSTPGNISTTGGVGIFLAFSGATGNDGVHKVRLRLVNPQTGVVALTQTSTVAEATSASVTIMTVSAYVAGMEDWRLSALANRSCVVVDFDGGTTNIAHVYWVAYKIPYRPQRSLMIPEAYATRSLGRHRGREMRWSFDPMGVWRRQSVYSGQLPEVEYRPAVYKFDAHLYGNVAGPVDDGSGTYTGSAAALIQRPPDVLRWLAATFGSADPSADFETGSSAFGSFTDLRTLLRDDWPTDFTCALYLGSQAQLGEVVKTLAASCLVSVWLDRFTGKWRVVPWKRLASTTYGYTFKWDEIELVSVECLSALDSCQEVRLQYGFDHYTQRPLGEAYVSPDGSGTGVSALSKRDQAGVTITAGVNDWVDFTLYNPLTATASNYSVQLTPASYTEPIELAKAIQDSIVASLGLGSHPNPYVGWSFCVKAGYNDSIAVRNGIFSGTIYTATLTAGEMNAADRAQDVQDKLNASGFPGTFTVTYDPATGYFTVACTATFSLLNDVSPVTVSRPGWHVLGFVGSRVGASSYVGDSVRWAERYYFDATLSPAATSPLHGLTESQVKLRFGSGAHAATTPAHELGYLPIDTGYVASATSDGPRGMREATAASLQAQNGPRPADSVTAEVLIDETCAARVRNRRFDMRSPDRSVVVFRTTVAPDLQRLQGIDFDSSLDPYVAFPRYGSDGSWNGKVFRVLSVTQYVADAQCHQEITAVEMW